MPGSTRQAPERLHLEAEACRLGYRDRAALIADPDAVDVPVEGLLSAGYADAMRAHISPTHAMPAELPPGYPAHGDTIYLTVVDGDGNAISFINSLFASFGSGLCTGVRRDAAEPGGELPHRRGPPQRHRGRQAADAHDHPRHGGPRRARGNALRRHGRALPGLRARPLPHQRDRLRHGPAGGARLPPRLPLRRRHGAGDHHCRASRWPNASRPSAIRSRGRISPTAAARPSPSTARPACSPAAPTPARTAARWGSDASFRSPARRPPDHGAVPSGRGLRNHGAVCRSRRRAGDRAILNGNQSAEAGGMGARPALAVSADGADRAENGRRKDRYETVTCRYDRLYEPL